MWGESCLRHDSKQYSKVQNSNKNLYSYALSFQPLTPSLVILCERWLNGAVLLLTCLWSLNSIIIEPPHEKTNKMTSAPNETSNQPGHPPSLTSVFAVRKKKPWVLSYPLSEQRRLIRPGGCPGWSEFSLDAHVTLLVLSCTGSIDLVLLWLQSLDLFMIVYIGQCFNF